MLDLFHARFRQVAVVVPILTGHSKSRRVPTVAEAWQGTLPHRTRESHNLLLGVCLPSETPLRYTRTMENQEPDQVPVQPQKRGRGRPVERQWPDPIPDTPENVARALMAGPPKAEDEWEYLKKHRNRSK